MYSFRKSNKGFTLIELMVVVMIIGVLVLLGLRAYSSQKERAMNSIVKANAGTIQTMLVGYMGDFDIVSNTGAEKSVEDCLGVAATSFMIENMVNPYNDLAAIYFEEPSTSTFDDASEISANQGMAICKLIAPNDVRVNARGKKGELIMTPSITRSLPANKY